MSLQRDRDLDLENFECELNEKENEIEDLKSEIAIKKDEIMRQFLKENTLKTEKKMTQYGSTNGMSSAMINQIAFSQNMINSNLPSACISPKHRGNSIEENEHIHREESKGSTAQVLQKKRTLSNDLKSELNG